MSTKGKKSTFAPGGRDYERKKSQNKRRGAPRGPRDPRDIIAENEKRDSDEESGSGEEGSSSSGDELFDKKEDKKPEPVQKTKEEAESGSDEEGSEGDEDWKGPKKEHKPKGTEGLIEFDNPNRAKRAAIKVSELKNLTIQDNTRKDKEAVEKARIQMKIEDKDRARLAEIRKKREEDAKRREEEQKAKEAKAKAAKK